MLAKLGEHVAAEDHRKKGFTGHSIVKRPFRGDGEPISVLLIVSALGGNIPTELLLDGHIFAVSALYAEYHDPAEALPPHDVVFNAVGDADLCARALAEIPRILARTTAPVINPPERILPTGRGANAERLADIEGIIVPRTILTPRDELVRSDAVERLGEQGFVFPLLLRAPGFHTGQHFLRVENPEELPAAVSQVPGDQLFVIQYLDARGADGLARKYRVMIIDGVLYPLHLASSRSWKVHYFTSDMEVGRRWRLEELYIKAYPCCRWSQGAIAAAVSACNSRSLAAVDVRCVKVRTFAAADGLAKVVPQTTEEAQYSLVWPVACALVRGGFAVEDVLGPFSDPELRAMFERVEVDVDTELTAAFPERRLTAVEIELVSGERLEAGPLEAPGEPDDPALTEVVAAKVSEHVDAGTRAAVPAPSRGLRAQDREQLLSLLCNFELVLAGV